MIIIRLMGGLGNQLFQYSMARRVAYINNVDLKLDISWFNNISSEATPRSYSLNVFNIVEIFALPKEIKKFRKNKIYRLLEEFKPYHWRSFVKEHQSNFNPKILKLSDNTYIEGYWQSEKYFKDIKNIIRKEFVFKKPIINNYKNLIDKTNSVSIHIRRGDYVTNKRSNQVHGLCSMNYYYTALKKIIRDIVSPYFFIFSDDINWVKKNLKIKYPVFFVSNQESKDYEELALVRKCKHNIIANSSFSWWGAWLNNNPKKIVVAPKKWFKDPSRNNKDLIPESWIKI